MVAHLTASEKDVVRKVAHSRDGSVLKALEAVNKLRRKAGIEILSSSPIYRFLTGRTYQLSAQERRGRKKVLTKKDAQKLMQARSKS